MAIDWKTRLVDAQTKATARVSARDAAPTRELQKVVEQVIASGVSPSEVRRFLVEHDDVFGDDAVQIARRAGEAFLDQTSPRRQAPISESGPASSSVKAHAVRFPAVPWFQRVSLPLPPAVLLGGGDVVVVDGERFSQGDVAALLRSA